MTAAARKTKEAKLRCMGKYFNVLGLIRGSLRLFEVAVLARSEPLGSAQENDFRLASCRELGLLRALVECSTC